MYRKWRIARFLIKIGMVFALHAKRRIAVSTNLQRHTRGGHHQEGGAKTETLVNKVSDNVMDDEQQIDAAGPCRIGAFHSNERGLP